MCWILSESQVRYDSWVAVGLQAIAHAVQQSGHGSDRSASIQFQNAHATDNSTLKKMRVYSKVLSYQREIIACLFALRHRQSTVFFSPPLPYSGFR
jgi:hypothetical protein